MRRHRTLFAMKTELKTLRGISYHYRHLHITRCLLKGRKIEEIESSSVKNPRDEKYLARLMEKWSAALQAEHAEDLAAAAA